MKKALSQISKSPFTRRIEKAMLSRRFHQLTFVMYNGRTDPVEHVNQFKQKMVVHSQDEALMCKVFSSSLGQIPSILSENSPNHSVLDSLHAVGSLNL